MLSELFGSFAGQLSLLVILFMIVAGFTAVRVVLKKCRRHLIKLLELISLSSSQL